MSYVLSDSDDEPYLILIGTGSEVALAEAAGERLRAEGMMVRVVSMPSWELFDAQDPAYRESVLPSSVGRRLAIEAATPLAWERYVGPSGDVLGVEGYGASAPASDLAEHFGFTVDNVVERARRLV